ncbi:hypothetical protein BJ508DRAFT_336384 [Ascobolus immersus RN42]|uniref:Uncharacterized protein n=1 Tax=Ascobolus immersus RN42 TaxID=1160509 RepID=A0A3N4H8M3_ASCIM|nr:hypothetical protein BJ508DRAFT_336384 [Ascobolus immersus RN42]
MSHHYLQRRHNWTVEQDLDLKDFQEGMKKRRKTLKMLARREAEKAGRNILADLNLELLDEDVIKHILDIALHEKYEMHTVKIRRTKPLIYEATGIKVELNHRCPKGCMAFTKATQDSCDYCGSKRYKADEVTPTATYPYIKLLPRLRLWFSDPAFVEMMCTYRRQAEKEKPELTDYWNSGHFKKKKREGLFNDRHKRDMAFLLTTDELSPYKSRAYYKGVTNRRIVKTAPRNQTTGRVFLSLSSKNLNNYRPEESAGILLKRKCSL